jgi:hypothetical protein
VARHGGAPAERQGTGPVVALSAAEPSAERLVLSPAPCGQRAVRPPGHQPRENFLYNYRREPFPGPNRALARAGALLGPRAGGAPVN